GTDVTLGDVVHHHDVAMTKRSDGLRLAQESLAFERTGVRAGKEHFECDEAVELEVPRPINHAHAAVPEQAFDRIAGNLRKVVLMGGGRHVASRCRPGRWKQ